MVKDRPLAERELESRSADDRPVMLITGTSRGIGLGMAEHFVGRGYLVVGCSRGPQTLDAPGYEHHQVDVCDERQVQLFVRSVRRVHERIDVLVCSAGLVRSALMMTVTSADLLDAMVRTHVHGTFFICREVSKAMILRKSGRIITMSSLAVPLHLEGTSAYAATKGAVVEMTKVMARELAPLGITCNVLAPALIMTESAQAFGQEWADRLLAKQTLKRAVTIEEICNVVDFYAAEASAAITGQVIHMGLVC